ncbi:hypothetical protein LCGC14_2973270 [marine sediment metagenome]|uniref:Uncharacterized protein n=1 Tax=marine sediment metagenome TaxID=412755 RepID=A0A0F8X9P3_9ZZZZ
MKDVLLALRHKLEKFVDTLGASRYGAGTDLTTGETDFSFDLSGKTYSVRIAELKQ